MDRVAVTALEPENIVPYPAGVSWRTLRSGESYGGWLSGQR
jgi:hypothetical protein